MKIIKERTPAKVFPFIAYKSEKTEKPALIIHLHGAGERGNNLTLLKRIAVPKIFDGEVDCPAVVISPQCRENVTWNSQPEKVYEFIFALLDEIIPLFESEYFHIGGDEVPKTKWKNCEDCRKS